MSILTAKALFLVSIVSTLQGCDGGLDVTASKTGGQESVAANENFLITKVFPNVAQADDTILILGKGLTDKVKVKIEGDEVPITVLNSGLATFSMPLLQRNGLVAAQAELDQIVQKFNLHSAASGEQMPTFSGDPAKVCQGDKFIDEDGNLVEGTRVCEQAKDCSADGELDCLTNEAFKAADMSIAQAGAIKTGVTLAGVPGEYPSANYPLADASNLADLTTSTLANQIKTADGFEFFDSTGARHIGNGDPDLVATNVAAAVDIFGTVGTHAAGATESHSDCNGDGQVGCVTTNGYKSADMTNVAAGNVKSGITIAGVAGAYPSIAHPLAGSSPVVNDLESTTFEAKMKSATQFEYFDSSGARHVNSGDADIAAPHIINGMNIFGLVGSLTQETHTDCSTDGELGCITTTSYLSADMSAAISSNIKSGTTIAGIIGSVSQESHSDCSVDGAVGCITTTSYKAADMVNVSAATVKAGTTIAGVVGDFPSVSYPLTGSSALVDDLDNATFEPKLKSSTQFEYFDSTGARYLNSGDADILASNIANGVGIFGQAGAANLETHNNCTADGVVGCVTTNGYKSADMSAALTTNIKVGTIIAGVVGSAAEELHVDCSSDGTVGCVTTSTFTAADMNFATPANIKSGVTVAGVAGALEAESHVDCAADGTVGCVTTSGFKAADMAVALTANIKTGVTIAGVLGSAAVETHDDCHVDGEVGCVTTNGYKAADMSSAVGPHIKSGITIAGVSGSVSEETHSDCGSDGAVGCITTNSFKSADMNNVIASAIKSGITIAGVLGGYPSATYPLDGSSAIINDLDNSSFNAKLTSATQFEFFDSSGARYMNNGDLDIVASNIPVGVDIFGTVGVAGAEAHVDCAADGEVGCVTTLDYRAADMDIAIPENIKNNVIVAGTSGTMLGESHNDCIADGGVGCVTTLDYVAANKTLAIPANIRSGIALAGVAGSLVEEGHVDCIADGATGCVTTASFKAADMSLAIAANIKSGVTIASVGGSITSESHSDCASDGIVGCVTTSGYKSANMTTATVGNIKSGVVIAGVTGNAIMESHSDCAVDGGVGCVTTSAYKAADMLNVVAGNIKTGIAVAGVTGAYPSASYPLAASSAVVNDLDNATFSSKVKSTTQFEYFDSAGARYLNSGDSDIVASNIATGVDIFGTVGNAGLEAHINCTADGAVGCVTTNSYKSANMTFAVATNIKSGATIAGIGGSVLQESHTDCTSDGATGCITSESFKAADMAVALDSNIRMGTTIAGVAGIVTNSYTNCNTDGQTACVTSSQYKAARMTGVKPGSIKNGVTIAGVTGILTPEGHNDCSIDGMTGCVTTSSYKSASMTTAIPGNIRSGVVIAGVIGSAASESHNDCGSDGEVGCVTTSGYKAANMSSAVAANIRLGSTIAGVPGSVNAESHSDCSTDGAMGCITTSSYKAANMSNVSPGNIRAGVAVAGVTGQYPSATYPIASASITVADLDNTSLNAKLKSATQFEFFDSSGTRYLNAGDTDLTVANIANSVDIFGTTGTATLESHNNCAVDGALGCITVAAFKAADMTRVIAANIKSGVTIAGVPGSAVVGSFNNCAADGELSCITTASFKAANMANVVAGNIKSGATIAGVLGGYPSASYPLASSDSGIADLTSTTFNTQVKSATAFEYFDSIGARYIGAGDTDITSSKIQNGIDIFGTGGSLATESHSNCVSDGATGCITTASYKAANMTNVTAGNIRNGIVVAGVSGLYPSITYPLPGASATADLVSTTANNQFKSSTAFEYWNSAGTRQTGAGDANIVAGNIKTGTDIFGTVGTYSGTAPAAWDVRAGTVVNGVTGALKVNCRNTIVDSDYNYDGSASSIHHSGTTSGTANNWWDTTMDFADNGAFPPQNFPTGWTSYNYCSKANYTDVTADGNCSTSTDFCMFRDNITNLIWGEEATSSMDWGSAIGYCDGLSGGGYTDWRLPTQKELMQAYVHGIRDISEGSPNDGDDDPYFTSSLDSFYWSATSAVDTGDGYSGSGAYQTHLGKGWTEHFSKNDSDYVICVRP
ncbi:MAG: DUF1566 domain-containing protein [Oligoflexales bacterium]